MLRILDKPAGLTTHTSLSSKERARVDIDPMDSFLGHLTYRSGLELFPVHRLDLGTTGVLLAADSSIEAAELAKIFESREIQKTYRFLTDGKIAAENSGEGHVESFIDRHVSSAGRGSNFFSAPVTQENPVNAITDFKLLRQVGIYSLWEAKPHSGRPHQIRLHAESLGIPILGDGEHGGTSFPVLCLHAARVQFEFQGKPVDASMPEPIWFSRLAKFDERSEFTIINWLNAIERRERLNRSLKSLGVAISETRRLIHADGQDLRADQLGAITHMHWYGAEFDDIDRDAVKDLAKVMDWKDWFLQSRPNRGKTPTENESLLSRDDLPTRWQAKEESLTFTFRRDTSMSAGLFLDQRANRRWIHENAKDKRLLNLFAYTSGFSLAAARGGAEKVVSVDLSKNFMNWSKENFTANGLAIDDPRFEFRAMEAFDYLKWAKKKELQFDLVICDPPSFARTENGVFRIEKELENLIEACADVTAPTGRVLFSSNYELLQESELFERAGLWARGSKREAIVKRTPSPDLDFEFPRESRAMKSLFIEFS